MLVILSRKVDSETENEDELFQTHHYPARYRNQVHSGDTFIYYQVHRHDSSQRYYFGTGKIGEIFQADEENYCAQLTECKKFATQVPIYLPDGGYIEQLGYASVRKSINPPWQNAIRPISQEAYDYIMKASDSSLTSDFPSSVEEFKEELKKAVRDFYVGKDNTAILRIESIANTIACTLGLSVKRNNCRESGSNMEPAHEEQSLKLKQLLDYCRTMKMSYSYKPVLIMSLFQSGKTEGKISIQEAAQFFRKYYTNRRRNGLCVERNRCIYQNDEVTDRQIEGNIITNPVHALVNSGFFLYDSVNQEFSILPDIQKEIDGEIKLQILKICNEKLNSYYGEV